MTPDPPETYAVRVAKYQRREQMTIWVAAGIAALVAFIAARALDGAPRPFTEIIFTCVIAAGAMVALARVGFEWQATCIKRRLLENPTLEGTFLAVVDQKWPSFPETCWRGSLIVMALAWILMGVGIWWPRQQSAIPTISSHIELPALSIGGIGPFSDCSADLPSDYRNQLDTLVQNYRSRVSPNARAALIILVGTADNRRLAPKCAARFGTNEQLAVARANQTREQLEKRFLSEPLQPSYTVLTSGPRHLEASVEGEERRKDRAVNAWVVIDLPLADTKQKP